MPWCLTLLTLAFSTTPTDQGRAAMQIVKMKMLSATLFAAVTLISPWALAQENADAISVLTINSLRIQGQPVVLQEEAGDCLFFGDLAHTGNVHIEIKVCTKDDGSLLATYYPAIADVDLLPVLESIRLYLREDWTTPRN